MKKQLTTQEAAEHLAISTARVRQLILTGRLPAKKWGRDWIIRARDLEAVQDRPPGRPRK